MLIINIHLYPIIKLFNHFFLLFLSLERERDLALISFISTSSYESLLINDLDLDRDADLFLPLPLLLTFAFDPPL